MGDYFYVIQKGRTKVEYNTGDSSILLATLDKGAFFGEDALISSVPRNASIIMATNGVLMRLSEKDFTSLLYAPLIEKIDREEAESMIKAGNPETRILDVRTRQEFQDNMIAGSINIPVLSLRQELDTTEVRPRRADVGRGGGMVVVDLQESVREPSRRLLGEDRDG